MASSAGFTTSGIESMAPPTCASLWGSSAVDGAAPTSAIDRVLQLHRFAGKNAFDVTDDGKAALPAIAAIAVASWPADLAALPSSTTLEEHWADVLVDVLPSPTASEAVRHSARRVAVCCVAEMSNYPEYCEVLLRQCPGFLGALPGILVPLLAQYRWTQSYPSLYAPGDDSQWQLVAERMVGVVSGLVNSMMKYREGATVALRPVVWPCVEAILKAATAHLDHDHPDHDHPDHHDRPDRPEDRPGHHAKASSCWATRVAAEASAAAAAGAAEGRLEKGLQHLRDVIFDRTLCSRKLGWDGDHMSYTVCSVLHIAMNGPATQAWLLGLGARELLMSLGAPSCRLGYVKRTWCEPIICIYPRYARFIHLPLIYSTHL